MPVQTRAQKKAVQVSKNVEETSTGDRIIKTYKYMILSEKQKDGSWLMKWDIYNFDANY